MQAFHDKMPLTALRMHPKHAVSNKKCRKKFYGEGTAPYPDPIPSGEADTPSNTAPSASIPRRLWCIDLCPAHTLLDTFRRLIAVQRPSGPTATASRTNCFYIVIKLFRAHFWD